MAEKNRKGSNDGKTFNVHQNLYQYGREKEMKRQA